MSRCEHEVNELFCGEMATYRITHGDATNPAQRDDAAAAGDAIFSRNLIGFLGSLFQSPPQAAKRNFCQFLRLRNWLAGTGVS